jgi:hypothetical protein
LKQRFWGGAQAAEEQVLCLTWLAVSAAVGGHLHNAAGADRGFADVVWRLFGSQRAGDVAAVTDLVIRCHDRGLLFPWGLAGYPAMQRLPVGLGCHEEVGPLLEVLTNVFWVWSASAWISSPSEPSSPSSFLSTARS